MGGCSLLDIFFYVFQNFIYLLFITFLISYTYYLLEKTKQVLGSWTRYQFLLSDLKHEAGRIHLHRTGYTPLLSFTLCYLLDSALNRDTP